MQKVAASSQENEIPLAPVQFVYTGAPTVSELALRLTYVERVMDERHRLYKERADNQKVAVDDALAAVKDQTKDAFAASEKAIAKQEDSQKTYNQGHNDLSRKMELQYASMVPSSEAKLKWEAIDKAIEESRRESATAKQAEQNDINGLRTEFMREISTLRESHSKDVGVKELAYRMEDKKGISVGNMAALAIASLDALAIAVTVLVIIFKHS